MPETPGEMFQRYDVDKSGALDRTEVQFALADLGALKKVPPSAAADIFDKFDTNGDGVMDEEEFKILVAKMEKMRKVKRDNPVVDVPFGYQKWDGSLDVKSAFLGFCGGSHVHQDELGSQDWVKLLKECNLLTDAVDATTADIIYATACAHAKKRKRTLSWDDGTFLKALALVATEHRVSFGLVAARVADFAPIGSPTLRPKKSKLKSEAAVQSERKGLKDEFDERRMREMFERYDMNSNGTLDLVETGAALVDMGAMARIDVQTARNLFEEFDTDGNGDLSFDEFKQLVSRTGEIKARVKILKPVMPVPDGFATTQRAKELKDTFDSFADAKGGITGTPQEGMTAEQWALLVAECGLLTTAVDAPAADLMFVKAQGPKFRKARKLLKWEDGTFLDAIAFMATELSVSFDEVAMKVARYGPAPSELAAEGGVVKGFSSVNPQVGVFFCVLLALQYAAQPFLIKSFIPENVNKVSLVFACECVKIVIALVIMIGEGSLKANFKNWTPKVGLLSVVPAVVYAGQNFLLQTAYGSMDSVTFNCLNQTKLVSTALCVYLFFGVRQSFTQVVALGGLLLAGVMLSMDETGVETGVSRGICTIGKKKCAAAAAAAAAAASARAANFKVGVAAVLTASATSGVASAATQYSLQAHRRSSNAMTIEMALAAIPFLISSAGITSVADFDVLFANWTRATWVPVITSAFGGIFVGQVTKHLGGVAKGFAIVGGLVLTGIVQSAAVGALEVQHLVGLVLVAWSTYAHAANPPKPIDRVPPPRPGGAVSPVSSPQKMKSV